MAIELLNYPQGRHAFDIVDDTDEARAIIKRTLAFMQEHLFDVKGETPCLLFLKSLRIL